MKELLIKIRALFEGRGIDEATKAATDLGRAGDKAANSGLKNLRLLLDDAAGRAGIFGGAVSALGGKLLDLGTNAVVSVIGGLRNLAVGFAEGIKGAAAFADQLGEMASKTGQSVETVAVLQQAFKNAGMGAEAVAPAINKLQRALAGVNEDGEPTAEVFGRLGLSIDELLKTDSATALQMIGTAIAGLKDPALQAQAAFDIFGRSSVNLMAILKDPTAFNIARQQIGDLGVVLGASAEELGRFAAAYENGMDAKRMGFFAGAAQTLAGDLGKAADAMDALPTVKLGMAIGTMLQDLRAWVQPVVDFGGAIETVSRKVNSLVSTLMLAAKASPFTAMAVHFGEWFTSATTRAEQQLEQLKAKAEEASTAPSETGAQFMQRIAEESGRNALLAGQTAAQGVAETGAQAAEGIRLTADQIRAATQQITAAMAEANSEGVTPAITALATATKEGFARVAFDLQTAATSLQAAASQDAAAVTTAVQALVASLSQNNAVIQSAVQSGQTQLAGEITTLQQSLQATLAQSLAILQQQNTTFTQTLQSLGENNRQTATAVQSATREVSQQLAATTAAVVALGNSLSTRFASLQQQINTLAARIR